MRAAIALFVVLLGLQGAFWYQTHKIVPAMGVVPDVPSEHTLKALSFGDDQALYRLSALNLQNAGDTFGRFTALYKYDFNRLYHWFMLLGTLDNRSDYLPSMANYYFSQTQNKSDVVYIVNYLEAFAKGRIADKWWWQVQAAYLAQHKLEDLDRALELARPLEEIHTIPLWAQQMPAFVLEKRGEFGDALQIIEGILASEQTLSQGELNFMRYFIEERLGALEKVEPLLKRVDKSRITNQENAPDLTSEEGLKKKLGK